MADTALTPRPTRFAFIIGSLVVAFLVVLRPGTWGDGGAWADLSRSAEVAALGVGFWFLHRIQGLFIAMLGCAGVLAMAFPTASDSHSGTYLFIEVAALASLGWSMLMIVVAREPRISWPAWVGVALGLISLNATLWITAHETAVRSSDVQQLRQFIFLFPLIMLALTIPSLTRHRIALAVMVVAATGAGYGLAQLRYPIVMGDVLGGGDYVGWLQQWLALPNQHGSRWMWAEEYVVVPLMLLGIYRLVSRGFKMRRVGEMPLPWVLACFAITWWLVLGTSIPQVPWTLRVLAVWLPLFGVADLLISIGEGLVRRPPE